MICRMKVLSRSRLMATAMLLVFCSLWAIAVPSLQDEEEDNTRRIWNKRFREARDRVRNKRPRVTEVDGELIGLTIWRLRETNQSEPKAERVTADTLFLEGEHLRLSIEATQEGNGYLYIIDREVYADRTMSDPYLIFPSQTTPPGGNMVTAGKPVYVPAQGDPNPYFTLERSRRDHVCENLTIIISPTPLKLLLETPTNPAKLDVAQVAQWEKQWGGRVERREGRNGVGKQWTLAEREASRGERRLVQGDPLPQTIFLVKAKPGAPMMLQVLLQIAP
jgi:hypothetical protein